MDPDRIADYLIGDADGGYDPDLCCAIESLCDVPLPAGVDFQFQEPYSDACSLEQGGGSMKRVRDSSCIGPKSKASREKMRRDRLNDRFTELCSVLDPGRPPKSDKASILSDAARVLVQLRNEAEELKESNEKLLETIKDLKMEKNELRDEKTRLKADKERLEQQVKAMTAPPSGFMPHPMALHPAAAPAAYAAQAQAYAAQSQSSSKKAAPYTAFPGMGMWQWLPPAVLDTTQDAKLWPPNA